MTERGTLVRNTVLWIGAAAWVVWSYLIQDPAPDPWTAATRNGFTVVAVIVIAAVSLVLVVAWIGALREAAPGEDPGAATH